VSNIEKYLEIAADIAKEFPTLASVEAEMFLDKLGVDQDGDEESANIVPGVPLSPISVSFDKDGLVFQCELRTEEGYTRFDLTSEELSDLAPQWATNLKRVINRCGNPGISDEVYSVNASIQTEIGSRRLVRDKFQRVIDSVDSSSRRLEETKSDSMDLHYADVEDLGIYN